VGDVLEEWIIFLKSAPRVLFKKVINAFETQRQCG
jgi:hypothetical protein